MRYIISLFCATIALFITLFKIDPQYHPAIIISIATVTFFMFVYAVFKIRKLSIMTKFYNIERKRRIELEKELLKEIELSNIIIRKKSAPLSQTFRKGSSDFING